MANALYSKAKEAFLNGSINMLANTITVALVDTAYYSFANTHQYRSEVSNTAVVSTATLANKTIANGVFDADDAVFTSVSGSNCEALIFFQDTGVQSTSRLIAYVDTATGLPIQPNGSDISVIFSSGTSRIFSL